MTSRFSDDLHLVAPEDYVPGTVQALLAHLHLENASRHQQEDGIRGWLKTHEPGRTMIFTLRSKGFGHLLDQRTSA
ncbi:hypothetical protein KV112_04010 [Mycolicibacter sp. MYC123]|uniref:Uncharacterized protein n=1 Tax=[Mycobacterium] zoologicum TaxID=2872311 RepID=A0ABU5YFT4_9MYCO|nr:hypothetical protein [Mycolicibacter sp. MYC123]MEB3048912.1 hypothetical protein [Mycolicibacter sp. MYC123]